MNRRSLRLTRRLDLCAACRMTELMRRRESAGGQTVVPAVAKAVLWALCNHANDEGEAWPSIDTIAHDSDASTRSVQRVLDVFRDEGLLTTKNRARGEHAGRKGHESRTGATNAYLIDWSALERLGGADDDSGRTVDGVAPTNVRQPDARSGERSGDEDGRQRDASSDASPAHDLAGTDASGAENGRQRRGERTPAAPASKEEPIEPRDEPSPLPPDGGTAGGDGVAQADAAETTDRRWAERIVAAYPRTSSDVQLADEDAVIAAIRSERGRLDGATPAEILAAAAQVVVDVREGRVRPLWCRTWAEMRGYWRSVAAARLVEAADGAAVEARRKAMEREAEARRVELERAARRDGLLAGMSTERLDELRRRAIAEAPNEFARRHLELGDPNGRAMRTAVCDILEREEAGATK